MIAFDVCSVWRLKYMCDTHGKFSDDNLPLEITNIRKPGS
jgi:hypothetical protein